MTRHDRAPTRTRRDGQGAADQLRAVFHDLQPHAAARCRGRVKSFSIVLDRKLIGGKPDRDVARLAVADRVVHGFLRDLIQVIRGFAIGWNRVAFMLEGAGRAEKKNLRPKRYAWGGEIFYAKGVEK